jgi:hypothetical protein
VIAIYFVAAGVFTFYVIYGTLKFFERSTTATTDTAASFEVQTDLCGCKSNPDQRMRAKEEQRQFFWVFWAVYFCWFMMLPIALLALLQSAGDLFDSLPFSCCRSCLFGTLVGWYVQLSQAPGC